MKMLFLVADLCLVKCVDLPLFKPPMMESCRLHFYWAFPIEKKYAQYSLQKLHEQQTP